MRTCWADKATSAIAVSFGGMRCLGTDCLFGLGADVLAFRVLPGRRERGCGGLVKPNSQNRQMLRDLAWDMKGDTTSTTSLQMIEEGVRVWTLFQCPCFRFLVVGPRLAPLNSVIAHIRNNILRHHTRHRQHAKRPQEKGAVGAQPGR